MPNWTYCDETHRVWTPLNSTSFGFECLRGLPIAVDAESGKATPCGQKPATQPVTTKRGERTGQLDMGVNSV